MKIIALIQARMGSTRLPGKVMREVKGKPLIGYLLERVACAKELDGVIVAIPKCDEGSPLAAYLRKLKVAYYAGCEENDVAARFLAVLDECKCDAFARICADSPLIDPLVVDSIVRQFRYGAKDHALEFLSNVTASSLHGQFVEITTVKNYRQAAPRFTPADREHAGFPWFYRQHPSLCVDTEADFQRISRIIEQMTEDHTVYGVDACIDLARLN